MNVDCYALEQAIEFEIRNAQEQGKKLNDSAWLWHSILACAKKEFTEAPKTVCKRGFATIFLSGSGNPQLKFIFRNKTIVVFAKRFGKKVGVFEVEHNEIDSFKNIVHKTIEIWKWLESKLYNNKINNKRKSLDYA